MQRTWYLLPVEVAQIMRPHLGAILEKTLSAIRAEFPEPDALPDVFWANSRLSVSRSIEGFVEGIETRQPLVDHEIFARVGALQARAGRDIEETLSAFRLGGATCWREIASIGPRAGLAPDVLYDVAESLFVYIDELSSICARAYADQQAAQAGAVEAKRTHFVRLLISEPQPEEAALQAAAAAAGCRLDQSFAVLVGSERRRDQLAAALPPWALPGPAEREFCALVADPDAPGRRKELTDAISRAKGRGALGPTVGVASVSVSFRRAVSAYRLLADGIVAGGPLILAAEHSAALLITGDRDLARHIAIDKLKPLDSLPPSSRDRLEATLRAWLDNQGMLKTTAAELGIHPKTAKYRLDRLRDLLGDSLTEPAARFELELALHARELLAGA